MTANGEKFRKVGRNTVLLLCLFIVSAQPVAHAQLMPEADKYNFSLGGGFYSTQVDCTVASTGTDATISDSATTDEKLQYIYTHFRGLGLTPIQAAAVAGNISVESSGGPTIVEKNPKHTGKDLPAYSKDPASLPVVNYWPSKDKNGKLFADPNNIRQPGWGIIQWTPSGKVVGIAKKAGITAPIYEMGTQLDLVMWHMKNTSPTGYNNMLKGFTQTDLGEAVQYFEKTVEGALVPATKSGTRYNRALNAMEKYESSATLALTSSSAAKDTSSDPSALAASGLDQTGCAPAVSTLNTTDAGLIALIQKYAWPTPNHKPKSEQTDAYKTAIAAAKAAGKYIGGANGDDCGGFITRLMQDSGRDPHYGGGGNTTAELIYLKKHTELYKQVSFSEVKFGDIGIWAGSSGHTFMYIGDKVPGFKDPVVEAALRNGQESSAPRNDNALVYNNSHGATYFRYIGGSNAVL